MSRGHDLASILCVVLLAAGLSPLTLVQGASSQGTVGNFSMKVSVVPTEMPADGGTHAAIFIQLVSQKGQIVPAPQSYQVFLTSAKLSVASVQSTLIIQKGQTYGVATLTTTLQPGSTNITLAATGLAPTSLIATTYAIRGHPSRLVAFVAPPTLFAESASSYYFFVQLQDVNGTPTRAVTNLNVAVTSSAPSVLDLPQTLTIPAGQTDTSTQFRAGSVNGSATVTAQLNDLISGSTTVKSVFLPLTVSIDSTAGASVTSGSDVKFTVTALSEGIPVSGANVTWSVDSSADVFTKGSLTTDNSGVASATLHLGAGGNITVTVMVAQFGYGQRTASVRLSVGTLTLAVQLIPDSTDLNVSQPSGVTALVTAGGRPVSAAQVTWASTIGSFEPPVSGTGASGTARSIFSSQTNGNATVTAQAVAAGYHAGIGSTTIIVGPLSSTGGSAGTGGLLAFVPGPSMMGIPLYLVAAVVLVVVVFVFLRRRRGKVLTAEAEKPKGEEGAEDEEQ